MEQPPNEQNKWAGLTPRITSSLVLVAIAVTANWLGGLVFTALMLVAAQQMQREWAAMTQHMGKAWFAAGFLYITLPLMALIGLRQIDSSAQIWVPASPWENDLGMLLVFYLVAVVAATDIGAYFVGRMFGKRKICPAISPGKTWEGLAGGCGAAVIASLLMYENSPYPDSWFMAVIVPVVLACVAQLGDLLESYVKRRAQVKDAGTLIPGHGGLLDRLDGFTFTAPLFLAMVMFLGGLTP